MALVTAIIVFVAAVISIAANIIQLRSNLVAMRITVAQVAQIDDNKSSDSYSHPNTEEDRQRIPFRCFQR